MRASELAKSMELALVAPALTMADVDRAIERARASHLAGVCVAALRVPWAWERLRGSDVKTCGVVGDGADAPRGGDRGALATAAVREGAEELDVSIDTALMLRGEFGAARADVADVVRLARAHARRGELIVKVSMDVGLLGPRLTRLACKIAADVGADFAVAAGAGGTVTARVVELIRETLPESVGVKASGGIQTFAQAEELVDAGATRIGAADAIAILGECPASGAHA